jgi:amino-acid racemase
MKTVGLIGGMSWESTALYYKLLNQTISKRCGALHSARILLHSVDFQEIEVMQRDNRWQEAGEQLAEIATGLEHGGVDCILLCTNTMHKVAPQIESAITVPFLHLADATADRIVERGETRVGLLGTSFTMEEDFYCERLRQQGLEVLVPEAELRAEINRVIFDELCCGKIVDSSREIYLRAIELFREQSAQSVILGCTEIGMLVDERQSSLPLIDTTVVHVDAAVEFVLADL